jgi:hypothetical protein
MVNEYRIWSNPHEKATSKRGKWDNYELENLEGDFSYHTKEQEEQLDKISEAREDVEVELFFSYANEYSRLYNASNGPYVMSVDRLDSRPVPELTLVKKTTFERGASFKNFTGLQMDTVRISFKKGNRINF